MTNEPSTTPRHIGILLFDGVEELDAVGPWEAFWTRNHPDDGWAVSCLSQDGRPVTAARAWCWAHTTPSRTRRRMRCSSTPAARAPGRCFATRNTSTGSARSAPPSP
ncbi:hypothetical protein [Pengzhenrongella sp.]|uniref:hypothetical protein n=1 Tax=Pengzhenrongella sp. TaxID=2888820 RepID=UPI002F93A2FC